MTAFYIIGIIITIAISFFLVRKIENNTYRLCIFIANIIVLVLFIASGSAVSFVKKNLDSFLNLQISRLEAKANEIYPGSLDAQMDNFTGTALRTIDYLERTDNMLSVKDALISLKEICVEKINPFYKTANIILTVLFSIYMLCSFFLSLYLSSSKAKENKSIIFGETAGKTTAGMKAED